MAPSRHLALIAAAGLVLGGALPPSPAFAQSQKKGPPACAAISFRPISSGLADGEQDAGMYRSRFGKMELKATVQSGEPSNYYLTINGKKLEPMQGDLPKNVEPCLKSKHVAVPVKKQEGNCTGQRFRAVIDSTGKQKLVMLFGLKGNDWLLCSAGPAPQGT